MNKFFVIIIIGSLFFGCGQPSQIIHYEYNGVKINRLNKGNNVFFSPGYSNDEEKIIKNANVIIDYSFDHFLFGFMLFHKDGTIQIISGGGGEYKNLIDNGMIFYRTDSISSSFRTKAYDNLYQISDNLGLERNRNKSFGSRVKIIQ